MGTFNQINSAVCKRAKGHSHAEVKQSTATPPWTCSHLPTLPSSPICQSRAHSALLWCVHCQRNSDASHLTNSGKCIATYATSEYSTELIERGEEKRVEMRRSTYSYRIWMRKVALKSEVSFWLSFCQTISLCFSSPYLTFISPSLSPLSFPLFFTLSPTENIV